VNLASRITAVARPGSLLVERELREAIDGPYRWSFAGERRLRGIRGPVPLLSGAAPGSRPRELAGYSFQYVRRRVEVGVARLRRRRCLRGASIRRISEPAWALVDGYEHGRAVGHLGAVHLHAGVLERVAHGGEVGGLGDDLKDVVVDGDVLGAGLDGGQQVVFGVGGWRRRRSCPSCRTDRRPNRARRGCRRSW